MKTAAEPVEVEHLTKLNEYGPDDLFICRASFEDRCLSSVARVGTDFRTRFAVIFFIEESLYKKQVETNLFRLQSESVALPRFTFLSFFTILWSN